MGGSPGLQTLRQGKGKRAQAECPRRVLPDHPLWCSAHPMPLCASDGRPSGWGGPGHHLWNQFLLELLRHI